MSKHNFHILSDKQISDIGLGKEKEKKKGGKRSNLPNIFDDDCG